MEYTEANPLTLQQKSSCACGEHDAEGLPELDVRVIPHAIRHATILGALDSLAVGAGLVIIANHAPLPLLAQVEQRYGKGAFEVSFLSQGPEEWKVQFRREA